MFKFDCSISFLLLKMQYNISLLPYDFLKNNRSLMKEWSELQNLQKKEEIFIKGI